MIKHPVWATEVHPVPSVQWSQHAIDRWNWSYKPKDYYGDPHSQWDWMLFTMHKANQFVINFYMKHEVRNDATIHSPGVSPY